MAGVTIYHNPGCSKSRQTLELLTNKGINVDVVKYLENPPDAAILEQLLSKLDMEPAELLRKKEDEYSELKLGSKRDDHAALIQAMVEHPILIERPIVVNGDQARLGRPPESVLEIL